VPSKPAADNSDMESEGSDSDEDGEEEEVHGSGTPILQFLDWPLYVLLVLYLSYLHFWFILFVFTVAQGSS